MHQTILIIGGGFAGIRAALDLRKKKRSGFIPRDTRIQLISNKDYFEYYPAMYSVVVGASPIAAVVPLSDIFFDDAVEVIHDTVIHFDLANTTAVGESGSVYRPDYLVLALGSQNNFFSIPGLEEVSFDFRSVHRALQLRQQIDAMFAQKYEPSEIEHQLSALHFVIVGAGPTGVELAGDLAVYARRRAHAYGVSPSLVTIDLIEAAPRVLPVFSERVSRRVEQRLRSLGVNVLLNRAVTKGDAWTVYLKDMTMGTKTIIWTAGVKVHERVQNLPNVEYSQRKRLIVNEHLELPAYPNIFVVGDSADTQYAGLAQTALVDGRFVATTISARIRGEQHAPYRPRGVAHDIPVGPGWGVFVAGTFELYGFLAWWMRHVIDVRFFLSILPIRKVFSMLTASRRSM